MTIALKAKNRFLACLPLLLLLALAVVTAAIAVAVIVVAVAVAAVTVVAVVPVVVGNHHLLADKRNNQRHENSKISSQPLVQG